MMASQMLQVTASCTPALFEDDPAICEVAKTSKFCRDFASVLFVRQDITRSYAKGFVTKLFDIKSGKIVGFCYAPHLIRKPYTKVHYMGVLPEFRGLGYGKLMLKWVMSQSPHKCIRLLCEESNPDSLAFYAKLGFIEVGRKVSKSGKVSIELELKQ